MIEITMPKLSDTMEEGAILSWQKKPGDRVEVGDVIAEIETDKATMEYEAYDAGTLSRVLVKEGDLVSVGAPIAVLDDGSGDARAGGAGDDAAAEGGPAESGAGDVGAAVEGGPGVGARGGGAEAEAEAAPAESGTGGAAGAAVEGGPEAGARDGAEAGPAESGTSDVGAAAEGGPEAGTRDGRAVAGGAGEAAGAEAAAAAAGAETDDSDAARGGAGAGERNSAEPSADEGSDHRRFASPLVRKLARENNLDLAGVNGTGPGGRIIRTDIEPLLEGGAAGGAPTGGTAGADAAAGSAGEGKVAPTAGSAPRQASGAAAAGAGSAGQGAASAGAGQAADEKRGSEAVALSSTRRVIARRLGESARSIPHFFVTAVADAEDLVQLRAQLNEQLTASGRPKVSINDLLIRACALALREHPLVNASYQGDDSATMLVHHRINIGVAVASENGLVVPVIEDADGKSVTRLGAEAKELAGLANQKKLTPAQMSGGTFTISNLGMFGVEQFTAIINPPEGAILAVGGTAREPVVVGDEVVIRHRMRYTLSADHRIIDGALAAQFLQTLTRLIENPWTIIA